MPAITRASTSGTRPASGRLALVAIAAGASTLLGAAVGGGEAPAASPPRPVACREVPAGADLASLLAAAAPGDSFCLAPGDHPGPLRIGRGVTVSGPRSAVIRSRGEGTTVRLEADGAALVGATVDGSGGRYDLLDAAVHVQGRDARVEGVLVRNAVYGILVERAERVAIRGNEVRGNPGQTLGLRGDSIRLWETRDSLVEGNTVLDGRDVVVWYSPRNRIVGNRIERSRYGTHLMYSHDTRIEGNRYVANVTGLFLMYSRGIEVRGNLLAGSGGAAGIGLGLKESGNVQVFDNDFVANTVGIYVDMSPLGPDERNVFEGNVLRLGRTGIVFLGSAARNVFQDNVLRDNALAVEVEGGDDALAADWHGNDFDDYAGYDLDADGIGDVPYELRSLSSELTASVPALAFFRGTPALGFAEAIGRAVPIFEPRLLLRDPTPRVRPSERERATRSAERAFAD